jgi:hypothetical protein
MWRAVRKCGSASTCHCSHVHICTLRREGILSASRPSEAVSVSAWHQLRTIYYNSHFQTVPNHPTILPPWGSTFDLAATWNTTAHPLVGNNGLWTFLGEFGGDQRPQHRIPVVAQYLREWLRTRIWGVRWMLYPEINSRPYSMDAASRRWDDEAS